MEACVIFDDAFAFILALNENCVIPANFKSPVLPDFCRNNRTSIRFYSLQNHSCANIDLNTYAALADLRLSSENMQYPDVTTSLRHKSALN